MRDTSCSSVVLVAASLSGCRNKKEEARQKAELTKALDQFQAQIGELQKQASALHARFDKLPEDLPGIGPVRDDLHAAEEGLGVDGGRAQWLSGQLDKAFVSGNKEEIEAVRSAIPQDNDGDSAAPRQGGTPAVAARTSGCAASFFRAAGCGESR